MSILFVNPLDINIISTFISAFCRSAEYVHISERGVIRNINPRIYLTIALNKLYSYNVQQYLVQQLYGQQPSEEYNNVMRNALAIRNVNDDIISSYIPFGRNYTRNVLSRNISRALVHAVNKLVEAARERFDDIINRGTYEIVNEICPVCQQALNVTVNQQILDNLGDNLNDTPRNRAVRRLLPFMFNCSHAVHYSCVGRLDTLLTCPICREVHFNPNDIGDVNNPYFSDNDSDDNNNDSDHNNNDDNDNNHGRRVRQRVLPRQTPRPGLIPQRRSDNQIETEGVTWEDQMNSTILHAQDVNNDDVQFVQQINNNHDNDPIIVERRRIAARQNVDDDEDNELLQTVFGQQENDFTEIERRRVLTQNNTNTNDNQLNQMLGIIETQRRRQENFTPVERTRLYLLNHQDEHPPAA